MRGSGMIQVGMDVTSDGNITKKVAGIGTVVEEKNERGTGYVATVQYDSGTYGLVCFWEGVLAEWNPDRAPAIEVLRTATDMPTLEHRPDAYVLRISVSRGREKFVVKKFYGEAKSTEPGSIFRPDECYQVQ